MNYQNLTPLDDRYRSRVTELLPIFSEFGLMRYRTQVEIDWFIFLGKNNFFDLDPTLETKLENIKKNFNEDDFNAIKKEESTTNHDVKAVEYFCRQHIPKNLWSWIHFGCTSEDINATSYGMMLQEGANNLHQITSTSVLQNLQKMAEEWKDIPMLSRTHGQTATPSTVGKEIGVFVHRTKRIMNTLKNIQFEGKFGGATGNFAAHAVAFPETDWPTLAEEFVRTKCNLTYNPVTTQIEPHDIPAEYLHQLGLLSTVLIDFSRDIWGYISLGYLGQKIKAGEVGSSAMPHKVNPIDFENAEGNFILSRGIGRTLGEALPISRWQRDLVDSTLQRNYGLVFGYFLAAIRSLEKGIGKLELRTDIVTQDLQNHPEVLTEAVQTVLRAEGHADAYEQLKNISRGHHITLEDIRNFVQKTDIEPSAKNRLVELLPTTYTGFSSEIVGRFVSSN